MKKKITFALMIMLQAVFCMVTINAQNAEIDYKDVTTKAKEIMRSHATTKRMTTKLAKMF